MKKHLIDFPENNISIESFYDRLRPCYDSIMQLTSASVATRWQLSSP